MHKRKTGWLMFPLVVLLLTSLSAGAEDRKKQALTHFRSAENHYKLGRFPDALKEYSRAYDLVPLAGFLFNIGQCHRQLGNHERAVFFYEGYLREKPRAKNRKVVEALIEKSKQKLAQEKAEQAKREEEQRRLAQQKKGDEERLRIEKERLRIEEERRKEQARLIQLEQDRLKALAEAERNRENESPPFYKKWWFWTIVGVVVAGAAGGTAYALTAGDTHVLPSGSLGTLDMRGLR